MAHDDPHRITTLEQIRALVGEGNPTAQLKIGDRLDAHARAFIGRSPFLVLSTADAAGRADVSPKGDHAGFVAVEDERTLLIPDRSGNRLVFGLQNILANPQVGVLFMVPGTGETLRVNGRASLTSDPAIRARLSSRGKPAVLAIRVEVEECFFHCAKAFLRAALWKPETWPGDVKVSFGRIMADKLGSPDEVAQAIDVMIEENYRNDL
ncbi:MAG: pyridoxamine 5'-phosphate oxidase family protein [Deltaproteobacteria bacterium]|nr:pyridoxamine 5'-phosphate oxidase family protein [Deltaproteobacteria bacterium]